MTRPEWVEAGAQALVGGTNYVMSGDNGVAGTMNRLTAEFVIRAVEPLIRADERERREEFWEARWREAAEQREQAWTDLAHAEAVAARLVEVIVEMQADLDHAWAVANGEARR